MKSPAFQFYPNDYLSDTNVMLMTAEQEGHYIRLLCICWKDGSIPADWDKLKHFLKLNSVQTEKNSVQIVLNCFSEMCSDSTKLIHKRLEMEREKQEINRKNKSKAGKKSQQIQRDKRVNSVATDVERAVETELNSSVSISSSISSSTSVERDSPSPRRRVEPDLDPTEKPDVSPCITYYRFIFEKKFNKIPQVKELRDTKILVPIVQDRGIEETNKLIEGLLEIDDDPFIAKNGYQLYLLPNAINRILIGKKAISQGKKKYVGGIPTSPEHEARLAKIIEDAQKKEDLKNAKRN